MVTQTYGTVSGTITDVSSGLPLATATVTITGTTDSGVVSEELSADTNGNVSTSNYLTGTDLTVTASGNGYITQSNTISVAEGPNAVNLALEQTPIATGTISGTVVDSETSAPIANATVVLTGTNADGSPASESVMSDASGQFSSTIQFLAGTSVSLTISAEGYESTTTVLDSVVEGANVVTPSLTAVQVSEPTETPSPEPPATETPTPDVETPSPEPGAPQPTETAIPTEETPAATPISEDPAPAAPFTGSESAPARPVVSALPSTGSGGTSSLGLLIGASLTSATAIAVAVRRKNS